MKVIKPVTFTTAMLISSTAIEANPAWSSSTTYAKNAKVDFGTHIYQSLVNNNNGNNPETSPTFWNLVGPDNIHAMFDDETSTQTTATNSLSLVVAPGIINSLALINIVGSSVTVTALDSPGGTQIYNKTFGLDGTIITDWYQYFFERYDFKKELAITDLPPYANARITVTITGTGTVALGNLVMGTVYDIGVASMGASIAIEDYSKVNTDEFGITTLTRRNSAKNTSQQILIDRVNQGYVFALMDGLRSIPCVWIPSELDSDSLLTVYGIFSNFALTVAYPTHSLYNLDIKGMT